MKYISALLFAVIILAGCGDKTEQKPADNTNKFTFDSTDIKAAQVEDPTESFQLRYRFEKGTKVSYRLTTIANDNQTIEADTIMQQKVNQNIIYLFDLSGIDKDADNIFELECNFTSIRLDAQAGSQSFTYESGKADSADRVRYSEYEAMLNNPFRIRISDLGEIVEISRVDRIVNKYLTLKGYADSVTAEEKNMLKREIIEGAIRPLMIQVFREVPQHDLAKDSLWTKAQPETQFMIFKTQNTNKYSVENLQLLDDDKIAVINAGLDTKITGDTKFSDRGVNYQFEKPKTEAEGKIFFNITDGLIQKSKTKTFIDLFYTMEMDTPQGKQKGSKKESIENVNILERL